MEFQKPLSKKIVCASLLAVAFILFFLPPESEGFFFKDKKKIYVNALRDANNALGQKMGDFSFVDQEGRPFATKDFIGKPFLVTFIYTSCPDICPNLLQAVSQVVEKGGERFGRDFRVLTVAFDVGKDRPEILRDYGKSFTNDFENWKFITSDNVFTMRNFTSLFGFTYKKTRDGYDHINMTTLVGKDGVLMAHFFGDQYKPEAVLEALDLTAPKKLDLDKLSLVDRLLLFCSYYDPGTGEYKVDYVLMGQFAVQYILALGTIIFLMRRQTVYIFKKIFAIGEPKGVGK